MVTLHVSVRPCGIDDLEALRQVACETYDQTFRSMNTEETMAKYLREAFRKEKLKEELLNPRCRFFFLHYDDRIAGYLKLNEAPAQSDLNDPESLEIERIYVRTEFQGKGLGKTLINHSVEVALGMSKRYLWLGVWEKNARAIAFYQSMGFAVTGHHTFRMGDEAQNDLIMRKELTP